MTLHEEFESYRAGVMPATAGASQIVECRRAFYAGCQALMTELFASAISADGKEVVISEVAIEARRKELRAFVEGVKAGRY